MYTLHIEHPITDFDVWKLAFDRFADLRRRSGVRAHTVRRPVDDDRQVVIDLDFDSADAAAAFLAILRTRVWGVSANSPALAGEPVTRVLAVEESVVAPDPSVAAAP